MALPEREEGGPDDAKERLLAEILPELRAYIRLKCGSKIRALESGAVTTDSSASA